MEDPLTPGGRNLSESALEEYFAFEQWQQRPANQEQADASRDGVAGDDEAGDDDAIGLPTAPPVTNVDPVAEEGDAGQESKKNELGGIPGPEEIRNLTPRAGTSDENNLARFMIPPLPEVQIVPATSTSGAEGAESMEADNRTVLAILFNRDPDPSWNIMVKQADVLNVDQDFIVEWYRLRRAEHREAQSPVAAEKNVGKAPAVNLNVGGLQNIGGLRRSTVSRSDFHESDSLLQDAPKPVDARSEVSQLTSITNSTRSTEGPYPCTNCGKRWWTPSEWERHEREVHYREWMYSCLLCSITITTNGQFACDFCSETFTELQAIKTHIFMECNAQAREALWLRKGHHKEHRQKDHPDDCTKLISDGQHTLAQCIFCLSTFATQSGAEAHTCQGRTTWQAGENLKRLFIAQNPSSPFEKIYESWSYRIEGGRPPWPRECVPCDIQFQNWEERFKHFCTVHVQPVTPAPRGIKRGIRGNMSPPLGAMGGANDNTPVLFDKNPIQHDNNSISSRQQQRNRHRSGTRRRHRTRGGSSSVPPDGYLMARQFSHEYQEHYLLDVVREAAER